MFTSIQGEGERAGYPSIFIRVSGCNLRCVFGNTVCDTAYASFSPEKSSIPFDEAVQYCVEHESIPDIVITGGEPMLYRDQIIDLMCAISRERPNDNCLFTIETNGTLPVIGTMDLMYAGCRSSRLIISCSPKLSTAFTAKAGEKIQVPGIEEPFSFTQEQIDQFNETRINIDNFVDIINKSPFTQFKFVYTNEDSVREIKTILKEIDDKFSGKSYPPYKVCLMPEGIDAKTLDITRRKCAEACIENGWCFTDRLHINIWGNRRGV